ncbi:hypothetical protein RN001_012649 [Aquatica leii]|uniref:ABC transporter G family member 23 n=1 Tax=Aquatica leii TaxID=1421715 RepID=A0AAN7SDF2_9COLE|nr:hypothetical protein RN001_012649 [Aquatica leii]
MANQIENVSLEDLNQQNLSSLDVKKEQAVWVRHAYKRYGTKKNPFVVLDDLNMTVPKGSIYGLLGASGCGKTTLLGCIIGRKKLNSGEIWVLGGTPGSRGSGVPGARIGYMPQELALFGEFSIRETLHYFGGIAGMPNQRIEERIKFLQNLLMLPDVNSRVANCSGGQQRRVSLASALVHEPELLILDEPTVGVDPLLRQIIWDHLVNITQSGRTTIIITTHYIDETKQAHLIGLMRGGYFLAEESPSDLLTLHNSTSLEDVFLKLSVKQNLTKYVNGNGVVNPSADIEEEIGDSMKGFGDNIPSRSSLSRSQPVTFNVQKPVTKTKLSHYIPVINKDHMRALLWMNFLWMLRNFPVLLFVIILPLVQMSIFCSSIGRDPEGLKVAVVNYETGNAPNCDTTIACNSTTLSCIYLEYLNRRGLNLIPYESDFKATESVLKGKTYASIVIKGNYTQALQTRIESWRDARSWDIKASEIDILRDVTSKDIATFLKVYLYESFQDFIQDYLISCDISPQVLALPIQWKKPIYGTKYPNFTEFVNPGMILTTIFFLSVALTAGAMLIQRNQGSIERALVIGVTALELLITHIICQFIIMSIQMSIVLIMSFGVFQMTMNGSYLILIALSISTGFCGMCFGFAISCAVDNERMATYIAMGSFFPFVLLSGIVWPIEGMHYLLQLCSFFLPLTKATESLRSILQRGWGFSSQVVYMGFIAISLWSLIFLILSIILLKFKKDRKPLKRKKDQDDDNSGSGSNVADENRTKSLDSESIMEQGLSNFSHLHVAVPGLTF